ncbi:MAG: RluA family pseudouridine synthase [Ligilactobacillus animalis]|uniref:RluA family pseudouridine synthase n=1 Tax=Ligilactobacillus animalis TaxID=1605 RepID=UPI00243127E3|nr:RluA family pseudouridine synthase [Ligilactobacillus animalis]MCI5941837.1 RluA family pseudouridine synthase [Ligilactobacillus animalis]MDY2992316.1 RluA family pseudouridine synthase [Ligilactobacillus animalis]
MKVTWQKEDTSQQTLKSFLRKQGVSQRLYGKLKKGYGQVLVDGQKTKLAFLLDRPVAVTLELPADAAEENVAISHAPIEVIYEDEFWLVVNKPAGLTSVPGPSNSTDTLVNRVKGYLIEQNSAVKAPRIITRLDRYTSGLVLFAKHSFAQAQIADQVESHRMDKRYFALVQGQIAREHGFIEGPIARVADDVKYQIAPDGRFAKSEYWLEKSDAELSLVQVKLHTGRTHQIRVHFSENGHPLLGDKLYGGERTLIARQALHAGKLGFADPFTKKYLEFSCPIPPDMQLIIDKEFRN